MTFGLLSVDEIELKEIIVNSRKLVGLHTYAFGFDFPVNEGTSKASAV